MKKTISIAAALTLLVTGSGITGVSAADMDYSTAVAGAYEVTADMIFGIDDSSISAQWIAENIYTYDNAASNEELSKLAAGCTATYTIDLGENHTVIFGVYRVYISGSQGDSVGGITVYGSNDDTSYTELGKMSQLEGGAWNDISLTMESAYRYIKIEPADSDVVYTDNSNGVEVTGGSSEDESEGESELAEATAAPENGGLNTARTIKAVFIEATPSDDSETSSGTTQIGGGVGASGALGFYGSKFPDCRGHWAEEIIVKCTDNNLLDGYDDGNFYPDNPVTAAEFAKLYSAWQSTFYIVNDGYWAMPYIRDMLDEGVFENGDYADYGTYMTREMCAKAIINSLSGEYFPSELDQFKQYITDIDSASEECVDYVLKAYISGIMSGYDDGSFNPKGYVTRAEILTIIDRAVNEDKRDIPDVAASSTLAAETQTYYTAAVQVRKSTSANSMNYRLYGANAKYMTEDDPGSGLKIYDEFQGAQGMAFLMRFDLSDIIEREDSLTSIKLIINRHSNGDMPIGLFWYEYKLSTLDWNQGGYTQVINGSSVAGDDKSIYNSVVDNISAILPTWGNIEGAVPQEEKVQPFVQAELKDNQYVFELSLDELKAHMNEDNIVEFFATTVNYDRYGVEKDNKPRCYTAGELAPQLYCSFDTGEAGASRIELDPESAELFGGMLNVEETEGVKNLGNFTKDQKITYNFKAPSAGTYKMTINYAANQGSGGGTAVISMNGSKTEHEFAQTGSWTTYVYEDVGTYELKAGENTLEISDKAITSTYLINIREIILEKVN